MTVESFRHPEVRAERASKGDETHDVLANLALWRLSSAARAAVAER
jgi:hypothetical protein